VYGESTVTTNDKKQLVVGNIALIKQ